MSFEGLQTGTSLILRFTSSFLSGSALLVGRAATPQLLAVGAAVRHQVGNRAALPDTGQVSAAAGLLGILLFPVGLVPAATVITEA